LDFQRVTTASSCAAIHKQARRILNGRIAITSEQAGDLACDLAVLL
jgi:hypothetical protein